MIKNCGFFLHKLSPQTVFLDVLNAVLTSCHSVPTNVQKQNSTQWLNARKRQIVFYFYKNLLLSLFVPQDAYIENLTPPPSLPPSPELLFEGPEKLAEFKTTREKIYIPNFFEFVLWTHRNYSFLTAETRKSTMMSKVVAQFTKKTNFITFLRKPFFFIGCLWIRGRQFWQPCGKIFAKLPKTFAQVTKNDIFFFHTKKTFFLKFCPLDKYNVVFLTKLWKILQ